MIRQRLRDRLKGARAAVSSTKRTVRYAAALAALIACMGYAVSDGGERRAVDTAHAQAPSIRNRSDKRFIKRFKERVRRQALAHPGALFLEGPADGARIALTFDDGPDAKYTPIVLSILRKHGVKATFFMRGRRVRRHPDLVRAVDRAGHAIGIHSLTHTAIDALPASEAYEREVRFMGDVFAALVGHRPAIYRPPYGLVSDEQIAYFAARGVRTVIWSVDSNDWDTRMLSAQGIARTVLRYAHPGAIVLMHDACNERCFTHRALETIIITLKKRGYSFCTVPELIGGAHRPAQN